jgi:hypothetical protein
MIYYVEINIVLKGNFFEIDVKAVFANNGESHSNSTNTEPTEIFVIQ